MARRRKACCLKPEVKYYTYALENFSIAHQYAGDTNLATASSFTGIYSLTNNIPVGVTSNARIGQHINLISCTLKGMIYFLANNTTVNGDNPTSVRILLCGLNVNRVGATQIQQFFNNDQPANKVNKFVDRTDVNVYYDKVFNRATSTSGTLVTGGSIDQLPITVNIRVRFNRKVIFDDQNTTVPYLTKHMKNNLYWIMYGFRSGATVTDSLASFQGAARVYFTDL